MNINNEQSFFKLMNIFNEITNISSSMLRLNETPIYGLNLVQISCEMKNDPNGRPGVKYLYWKIR